MTEDHSLIDQIDVRPTGHDTYEGDLTALPFGRAFGGQVLAQAMLAGARTAPEYPFPTSMHAYFVHAARSGQSASYVVETTRDGGRFAWRRVTAKQADRVVVDALMCFQRSAPATLSATFPRDSPDPEELDSASSMIAAAGPELEWFFRRHGDLAMEARYSATPPPMRVADGDWTPEQDLWLRAGLPLTISHAQRGAVLTFLSDVNLIATPLVALGRTGRGTDTAGATFDHRIEFHSADRPVNGWLLYEQSTDSIVDSTVSASGRILSRDGSVLSSVSQQGLVL